MADQNHIGFERDNSIQHLSRGPGGRVGRDAEESSKGRKLGRELRREDLLCLLSMLEGELQVGVIMNNTFPHLFPSFMLFEE